MAGKETKRAKATEALTEAQRELSTWTLLFHRAVAERVGLHPTDHKCLDLIARMAPLTAGELAGMTGLTTGAVTAVVDRLERRGLVERERDRADRRKVYLKALPETAGALLGPIFAGIGRRMDEICAGYTERELAVITGFTRQAAAMLRDEVQGEQGGS